jgi:integrase/recombinase XerD
MQTDKAIQPETEENNLEEIQGLQNLLQPTPGPTIVEPVVGPVTDATDSLEPEISTIIENKNTTADEKPKTKKTKVVRLRAENEIDTINKQQLKKLLSAVKSTHHKVAILFMVDCGLRITECITLQLHNLDFKKRVLLVKSLKKRGETKIREIPLSTRLLDALADYFKILKPIRGEDYLFPNPKKTGHVTRKTYNQLFDRLKAKHPELENLHPHTLRHTFATNLVSTGSAIHDVKSLLGHTSLNTTLIYTHTPIDVLRNNIENAITPPRSKLVQWFIDRFKKKRNNIINYVNSEVNFTVGRDKEVQQIFGNIEKHINTILLGGIGIGKTHLLKQIRGNDNKILLFDDLSNIKVSLAQLLLYLYKNDKEKIFELMYGAFTYDEVKVKISRDTVANIIEEIFKITEKKEYTLIIDNVDNITVKGTKVIELLKDHFTIITSAREIAINKTNFIWNFDRVRLDNLSRTESLQLITKLAYGQNIEHPDVYRNHIYDESQGNPRVIAEMCDRFSKETFLTNEVIRNQKHIGGLVEIDMSLWVVVILALVAVVRYTKHEVGQELYRFIGGSAMIAIMLWRLFLSKSKRKFL